MTGHDRDPEHINSRPARSFPVGDDGYQPEPDSKPPSDPAAKLFQLLEHWITIGIGAVLVLATLLLLSGSLSELWSSVKEWPATNKIFLIVDKLLFVLMLVEILHTVRASLQSANLTIEPFLIVGLIASVRRILIVTVEISSGAHAIADESFNHAMIELGVLGGLTIVLIVSIFLARRSRAFITSR